MGDVHRKLEKHWCVPEAEASGVSRNSLDAELSPMVQCIFQFPSALGYLEGYFVRLPRRGSTLPETADQDLLTLRFRRLIINSSCRAA